MALRDTVVGTAKRGRSLLPLLFAVANIAYSLGVARESCSRSAPGGVDATDCQRLSIGVAPPLEFFCQSRQNRVGKEDEERRHLDHLIFVLSPK